jgi:NhaA family Na+:H+ antiporter
VLSALLASALLRARNGAYRRIAAEEAVDADDDGVPDVFERPAASRPPSDRD